MYFLRAALLFLLPAFALAAPTQIVGTVVNEANQPLRDVQLTLTVGLDVSTTRSTADGRFTLPLKPTTRQLYGTLLARNADNTRQSFQHLAEAKLENLRVTLRPARQYDITVVDEKGQPVPDAWIAYSANFAKAAEATTDATGRATLRAPADAPPQHILATKPTVGSDYFVFWSKGDPRIDPYRLDPDHTGPIKFVLNGVRPITIKVTDDDGHALKNVDVHPWYFQKPKKGDHFNHGLQALFRKTDENGLATFDFIPADTDHPIQFWTRLEGYSAPKRCTWDPAKNQATLETTMVRLLHVTGRVLDPAGKPAAAATVRVVSDCYEIDNFRGDPITTNEDGSFAIDVSPDMYYLFSADKQSLVAQPLTTMIRRAAPERPIELTLAPGHHVFGRITAGPDDTPVKDANVTLAYNDDSYRKLPKDEKFSGPESGRKVICPILHHYATTDEHGAFEFYTHAGDDHHIWAYLPGAGANLSAHFKVVDAEHEVNLHADEARQTPAVITGRVVLKDKPNTPAPEATLTGHDVNLESFNLTAVADRNGNFTLRRPTADFYLQAVTPDKKLQGIAFIETGEKQAVVAVGPTASATGRVLDHEGKPVADAQIESSIRVGPPNGAFTSAFGEKARTGPDGRFTLPGLVPGHEYHVAIVVEFDADNRPRGWQNLTKLKPATAETIDLGDLSRPKPYVPKGPPDYRAQAFAKTDPIDKRLDKAKLTAHACWQNIIVLVGDPDDPAAKAFFDLRYSHDDQDAWPALGVHVPLAINATSANPDTRKWLEDAKIAWPTTGLTLAILDPDAKLLVQTSSADLATNGKPDRAKLLAFGKANGPILPDAQKLLDDALAKAKREDKRVLIDQTGAGCGWCVYLYDYLHRNAALFEKDYVILSIEPRMKSGNEIIKSLRKTDGGIPWMIILDADAKPLITADSETGNIGYPGEPEGKTHWRKMLKTTAKHLTDAEIDQLIQNIKMP